MKVAVSGANGFIGRYVLAELARRNCDTIALLRGPDPGDLPGAPKIVSCDLTKIDNPTLEAIGDADVLIHLAWGGLPNYRSPHHYDVELPAQHRFLSALVRNGLKTLVSTGTCFEYGFQYGPLTETIKTQPSNSYGIAKDSLRQKLERLQQEHPFNFCWGRLFYIYGEGQGPSSLFSLLKSAVDGNLPQFNMSGGEQLRDYLPVETVAAHIVELALRQANCGIVNICSGEPISVRRLVETWCQNNGWQISLNLHHYPYADHEPMAFWGDPKKLKMILAA